MTSEQFNIDAKRRARARFESVGGAPFLYGIDTAGESVVVCCPNATDEQILALLDRLFDEGTRLGLVLWAVAGWMEANDETPAGVMVLTIDDDGVMRRWFAPGADGQPLGAWTLVEEREAPPTCRLCGCTDLHACPEGCVWVTDDLCSACVAELPAAAGFAFWGAAIRALDEDGAVYDALPADAAGVRQAAENAARWLAQFAPPTTDDPSTDSAGWRGVPPSPLHVLPPGHRRSARR